jgi:hypothetical protein
MPIKKRTTSQDNEPSLLEPAQQFTTKLLDELPAEDDQPYNHLSMDNLHALVLNQKSSNRYRHGHIIIVGNSRQIQLVSAAIQPTELYRVYDITYLETRGGSLSRHQPTPSWVSQDTQQTCRRALDIYVDEERALGADGESPFTEFCDRLRLWYANATGNKPPGRTKVASVIPPQATRTIRSDGRDKKYVIWDNPE